MCAGTTRAKPRSEKPVRSAQRIARAAVIVRMAFASTAKAKPSIRVPRTASPGLRSAATGIAITFLGKLSIHALRIAVSASFAETPCAPEAKTARIAQVIAGSPYAVTFFAA